MPESTRSGLNHTTTLGHQIGAISLIAGTCVGGGMLALPIDTAASGFFPSILSLFLSWLFMMLTGLLLVEASLWVERDAHYMTLSSRLLGRVGKYLGILLYLFMGYGSLIAYSSGGSMLLVNFTEFLFGIEMTRVGACAIFSIFFGLVIYLGTQFIGKINTILVVGMILAYFAIVAGGTSGIRLEMLQRVHFSHSIFSFPLLLATFSYQMMVPSLTSYLNRDPKALRLAIILGTTIPFVAYAIWELIVLGTVPFEGKFGLKEALIEGYSSTESLKHFVSSSWLSTAAELFAFFAITTSFLGIGLGLFDYLADLTKIKKKGGGKVALILIAIIPTLILAMMYPKAFMIALEVSGGFGDTLLSILFPVSMVFVGRYIKRYESLYTVRGGKPLLVIIACFALFVLAIQIIKL
ncbi:MAG: amino acid transporter [Simkaniaceae bacterium]|nr:amino acid transporter [Simkaniaceae bacterium]